MVLRYILKKMILNLYIVENNHFLHNSQERLLWDIFDRQYQLIIFEDLGYQLLLYQIFYQE